MRVTCTHGVRVELNLDETLSLRDCNQESSRSEMDLVDDWWMYQLMESIRQLINPNVCSSLLFGSVD